MRHSFKIGIFIITSAIFLIPQGIAAPTPSGPQAIGQIVWVKGVMKATGSATPRSLQRRSPIFVKDVLVTDKNSSGEVVFTDNSVVAIEADSQFKIDEYQFGKDVPAGKSKYVASLVKGGFRTITGLIPKDNAENYAVHTPVATIAVQGTSYAVNYRGHLWVKMFSGKPCIRNDKGLACLTTEMPYGEVNGSGSPSLSKTAPAGAFQDMPGLTPASFTPTNGSFGPDGGTVSGFCIG